jgi:hypothetical protein
VASNEARLSQHREGLRHLYALLHAAGAHAECTEEHGDDGERYCQPGDGVAAAAKAGETFAARSSGKPSGEAGLKKIGHDTLQKPTAGYRLWLLVEPQMPFSTAAWKKTRRRKIFRGLSNPAPAKRL